MLRIRCAKCDRPVERVATNYDPMASCQLIVAFCHGKTDTMVWTMENAAEFHGMPGDLGEGVAFASPSPLAALSA